MSSLKELCTTLSELKRTVDLEDAARAHAKYEPDYLALAEQIDALMKQQDAMLAGLPDSRSAYDSLRKEVIERMNTEKVYALENVSAKWKERNEVNTSKVLQVIGGDMDIYISLSSITQLKLKDFAKVTPELKKPLLECIETVSREIVDLSIEVPLAA